MEIAVPKQNLKWNVCTIKEESQLLLLTDEMNKWQCDILRISETHRSEIEDHLVKGYKFVAKGPEEGSHRSGVGFLLSKVAQSALQGYDPVSDRILLAKFTTMIGCLTVIQVYAPMANAPVEKIDLFYDLLQNTINEQTDTASLDCHG